MTRKGLARLALAVFATGVLGLVAIPAWAAAGASPVDLAAVTGETTTTTKTCEPGKYNTDCPRPTKTHTTTTTTTTTKPPKTTTTTETKTTTTTETKTTTVPVTVTTAPTLPVTGSATTAVIVGGAALVLGGATLLGWLRRRREE